MLRRLLLAILVLIAVSPLLCSEAAAQRATKHKVTRVLVKKKAHTLQLFAGDEIVATYRASIGDGGPGHKLREGDKVTPVGRYHVTTHQPSHYKIFLRLDYPNAEDRARFLEAFGEALINRASTTWRGLDAGEREKSPEALLAAHPTLMKRPVIARGEKLWLGWSKAVQGDVLK